MHRFIKLVGLGVLLRKLFGLLKRGTHWLLSDLPASVKNLRVPGLYRLNRFHRHFIINLILGLGIALLIHQLHHSAYLTQIEDVAMDWALLMHRGTAPTGDPRPVAFIDIDEASYRAWGEPLLTPRDKLAALIEHAIDGNAAAVVVDVDLSRRDGEGDQVLKETLQQYVNPGVHASGLPPVILVRVLRAQVSQQTDALPPERETIFDQLVAAAPSLYWATAVFDMDLDGRVRRWRLWEAACDDKGYPVIYPSLQLQAKALLDGNDEQRTQLVDALDALTPKSCSPDCQLNDAHQASTDKDVHGMVDDLSQVEEHSSAVLIKIGDDTINLRPQKNGRRILYRIPWQLGQDETRPLVPLDGHLVPFLSVRSGTEIADAAGPVDADWLRGHLVIIGASHADSRDLYQTPLGLMPGALIVANAIESLDVHGELRTPGLFETLLVEAVLIAVMSLLFARFDSFWGSLLSGTAIIGILLPFSLWLFNSGYWLSFALPLLAVQFHQMASELEQVLTPNHKVENKNG